MAKGTFKEKYLIRPWVLALGLIITVAITVIETALNGYTNMGSLQPFGGFYDVVRIQDIMFYSWPFIILYLIGIMGRSRFFTKAELAVLLTMMWVTWMIPTYTGVTTLVTWAGSARRLGEPLYTWLIDDFKGLYHLWGPDFTDDALWAGFYNGASAVPWNAWGSMIAFSFFHPIVAPRPLRPAACPISFITQADFTRRSPA